MKTCWTVITQTFKDLTRNGAFWYISAFILLVVAIISATVSGGAEQAQHRAMLETCQTILNISCSILLLCSMFGVLWSSCFSLSREIDTYNIHLVAVKPCSMATLWFGKMLGVFIPYTFLIIVGYALITSIFFYRINKLPEDTMTLLKQEILVGREVFSPDRPNLEELAEKQYQEGITNKTIPASVPKYQAIDIIKRKLTNVEIMPQRTYQWTYSGMPPTNSEDDQRMLNSGNSKGEHILRLRAYRNEVDNRSRSFVTFTWQVAREITTSENNVVNFLSPPEKRQVITDTFVESKFPCEFVDNQGKLTLTIQNNSTEDRLVFVHNDGPNIYTEKISFLANLTRIALFSTLGLLFMAIIGTTVSACFTTPVAIFISTSYLAIGLLTSGLASLDNENFLSLLNYIFLSLNDFNSTNFLVNGLELPIILIAETFAIKILLYGGLFATMGIFVLNRREFAKQMKK